MSLTASAWFVVPEHTSRYVGLCGSALLLRQLLLRLGVARSQRGSTYGGLSTDVPNFGIYESLPIKMLSEHVLSGAGSVATDGSDSDSEGAERVRIAGLPRFPRS